MKILIDAHMIGENNTGIERYWKNLIINLSYFIKPKNIYLYCNLSKEKLPKKLHKFNIYNPIFKNGLYRIFFGFNEAIKKINPDIIHIQNFSPLFFSKKIPIVNTVHDICFLTHPFDFSIKSIFAFNLFFKHSLKISNQIICPSNSVKKEILKKFNFLEKNKIKIIYYGLDKNFYEIKNKEKIKNIIKKKLGIKKKYFLVVGEINKRKNPKKIIDFFKKNKNYLKKYLLVFVGPNKLKIKENSFLKILDYVSDKDLNYLYNCSSGLIYLSKCEGFGFPIIETLTTKTKIIDSNLEVFREIKKAFKSKKYLFNWKLNAKKTYLIYKNIFKYKKYKFNNQS